MPQYRHEVSPRAWQIVNIKDSSMKTKYINIKTSYGVETVVEFPYNTKEERKYFKETLKEYQMCMNVYPSQRCDKTWNQ